MIVLMSCSIGVCEVGEFTVSERLLNQLQFSTTQTQSFTKRGRWIQPNIEFKVSPQLSNANDEGRFYLDMTLNGSSISQSTTPVGPRHAVNASVTANIEANFQQEMILGKNGLEVGPFDGRVIINPSNIAVSNNFNLLNRIVNRKAHQKAQEQIAAEIPRERQEFMQQVQSEIEKETKEAKQFIDDALKRLAPSEVVDKNKLSFSTKVSTQTGKEGKLKIEILDSATPSERTKKPEFENRDQLMATGIIHQDLLTQSLSSEIAGKELKMAQLKKILCSPRIQNLLEFCKSDTNQEADGLSLVFDKVDPIKFIFNEGKITLQMNAAYRTGVPKTDEKNRALLNNPDSSKPKFETIPYRVIVSYKIQEGVAKLEKLSVTEKNPISLIPSSLIPGILDKGNHNKDNPNGERLTAGALLNPVIKGKIKSDFQKMLAEEFEFHSASIPTKIKAVNTPKGKEIQILEAGSLLPIEVKIEKGWLATGSMFCNDSNRPFGVTFSNNNRLNLVQTGSPAELSGFKPGDQIETYNEPEGRSNAFGKSSDPFITFITERAANKTAKDRKVVISGTDIQGKTFKRTVFLCPSNLDHKKQAAKGLAQFKK